MRKIVWKFGKYVNLIKSHDSVDKIVRFVYNIIEKRYFFLRTMIIDSLKRGMVICLLRQLN